MPEGNGHFAFVGCCTLAGGRRVRPALLHGDLWGGNWACDDRGEPFIFDPAVYCGDPEADSVPPWKRPAPPL